MGFKQYLSNFYDWLAVRLPSRQRVQMTYLKCFRRFPNLKHPKTFSEKIQVRKLFDHNPLLALCADKIAVKDYIRERIGIDLVIPTLFTGNQLPPIADRTWKRPFVIKATHGSGMNIFVHTASAINWSAIQDRMIEFLAFDYSRASVELFYSHIPRRIIVEPFLSDDGELPLDYKLFVFGGRTEMIQIDTGRLTAHRRVFYDPKWNRLDLTYGFPIEPKRIEKPATLDRMIETAAILGKPFPFVRIDFYEVSGKCYFGEMTFTPEGGFVKFNPKEKDAELGAMWVC